MNPTASRHPLTPIFWLAAGVCGALLVARFADFFPRFATHLIGDHGDVLLQHLHCAWQWSALAEGRFPELLRLPTFAPYPNGFVFGETLLGVTLPFGAIHLLLGSSAATYNLALISAYALLGLAVFLWVRALFDDPVAALLAAVLVVFVPWRLQLITNLNNMSVHFAVFGAWLLCVWSRTPRLRTLLGAALCFHIQLVTAAQVAVVAIYFTIVWFGVVWSTARFAIDRRRVIQLAIASALFLLAAWPWWNFFAPAFAASRGLPRTREMVAFASDFLTMARQFGVFGPLGAAGLIGAVLLAREGTGGGRHAGAARHALGIGVAAALLFFLGRGPYLDAEAITENPAYALTRALPFLSFYRAPVRLAAMTPLALAVLAGGGLALLRERFGGGSRRAEAAWLAVPLLAALAWPALPDAMSAPLDQRPDDYALAQALGQLPEEAVILSLPLALEPVGAAVDERVLVHRRRQIAGFASVVPPLFRSARRQLGQWPWQGHALVHAMGVTHVVMPESWLARAEQALAERGCRVVGRAGGRAVVAVPPEPPPQLSERTQRVPRRAAAGAWLTLAVGETPARFHPEGHLELPARWKGADGGITRVAAFAMLPGVVSAQTPVRIHVPTPDTPGPATLEIDHDRFGVSGRVEIVASNTSTTHPPHDVAARLTHDAGPMVVRAGATFPLDVAFTSRDATILLASSRVDRPFRLGEVQVVARFLSTRGSITTVNPGLGVDLVPGVESVERVWVGAPPRPGRYAVEIALFALGSGGRPSRFTRVLPVLEVVAD